MLMGRTYNRVGVESDNVDEQQQSLVDWGNFAGEEATECYFKSSVIKHKSNSPDENAAQVVGEYSDQAAVAEQDNSENFALQTFQTERVCLAAIDLRKSGVLMMHRKAELIYRQGKIRRVVRLDV